MSATDLQTFLRFLSQDAKVPLASAMGKVKELQNAGLDSAEKLAKVKANEINAIFQDEKVSKQILSAARRVAKKRAAGDDSAPSPKKRKKESLFSDEPLPPEELEASLELPHSDADESELSETVLFTNRAPLALAFVLVLLKYSMPEQPLSSRLSLAQGYISITSRARAVYLGIESGKSAEEEGFGEGTPAVTITGKEIKVLRRWGYEWKAVDVGESAQASTEAQEREKANVETNNDDTTVDAEKPALWALDLEALKKSNNHEPVVASAQAKTGNNSTLPIYTPQSARAYLVKSFNSANVEDSSSGKKISASAKVAEKERNLGKLLQALDMLYQSWAATLSPDDLDKRTWGWYVKVRPDVAEGAAGWGGKNEVKLVNILALRRET